MFLVAAAGWAEQLPIKAYNTADGLAHNHINRIRQDSRGFIWICTDEGLSRFDGYRFTNYTQAQGLPHAYVNDLLETRGGVYWVATDGGVCRLDPYAKSIFAVYRPGEREDARHVNSLAEDRDGSIWCATSDGLFRLVQAGNEVTIDPVEIGLPRTGQHGSLVNVILVDRRDVLWVGAGSGLYRRGANSQFHRYTTTHGLPDNFIDSLREDRDGRLWAGTRTGGLCRLAAGSALGEPVVERVYSVKDGLPEFDVRAIFPSFDGKLWIGTSRGLSEFDPADPGTFRNYTTANGLNEAAVYAIAEDRNANLWLGTYRGGVMKLAGHGLTSYGEADGLQAGLFEAIFETAAGEVCMVNRARPKARVIQCLKGTRFAEVRLGALQRLLGSGWPTSALQDRAGEWWVESGRQLFRFPKVSSIQRLVLASPKAVYASANGLSGMGLLPPFEDVRGDIWIVTDTRVPTRLSRSTGTFHTFREVAGLEPARNGLPHVFSDDAAGNLWIGFAVKGGLVRYRKGRFAAFTAANGLPAGSINALYRDRSNRIWIATGLGGLGRLDDPAAEHPRFAALTTADGLSSNEVWCLAEDQWGRIYIGTNRGVDRLDPDAPSGAHWKHYTTADGLAKGAVVAALRDRQSALWFVTNQGVSRLVPTEDPALSTPPVLISGLRIVGLPHAVSTLGEARLEKLELAPDQNHLQIDFVGLDFSPGGKLRYQYRLEGADQDWSAPIEQLTVNYASLSPGRYRFTVRSLNADGVAGSPASVAFTILRPVWQRWWFITLAGLLMALLAYVFYRYRVARLVELERVRTGIATDLHDDIGANLSRMAVLSEVVKREVGSASSESGEMLSEIAETARGMFDAMSDIVWSVDPRRDDVRNVVLRIRQFAADVLEAQGIHWTLQGPAEPEKLKLEPQQRRHVYLIFQEAIANAARHAACTEVQMSVHVTGNQFVAQIRDDGRGFVAGQAPAGNGLANIRMRAAALGGHCQIVSRPSAGTHLTVNFPLKRGRGPLSFRALLA